MADGRPNPNINPYSVFLTGGYGKALNQSRRQPNSNYRPNFLPTEFRKFVPESNPNIVELPRAAVPGPPVPGAGARGKKNRRQRKAKLRSFAPVTQSVPHSTPSNPDSSQPGPQLTQSVPPSTQPVPEGHADDDIVFLESSTLSVSPVPPPRMYLASNPAKLYFGGFLYKKCGAFGRGLQFNCDSRASGCRASLRLAEGAVASRNETPHNHERPAAPAEAGVSLEEGYNCVREEFRKVKRDKLKARQKARKLLTKVAAHPEVHVPQSSHLLPPMVHKPVPGAPPPQLPRRPAMKPLAPKPRPVTPPHVPPPPPPEVCLRWNSYHSNMQATFPSLLNNEQFVDVTLACEGRSIKCHKMMLSACSSYFDELLTQNPCQHPIVLMKDLKFWEIQALVDFMYCGEVNVGQDKLPSLLAAAEALQIKGLAGPASTPGGGSMGDDDSLPPTYDSDYAPDRDVPSPTQSRRARKRRVVPPQQQQQQQQQQVVPPPRSVRLQQRSATATSGSAPPPAAALSRHQPPHPSEPPARRMRMELTPSNIVETLREIKLEPLDIDDDSLPGCDDPRPPDLSLDLNDLNDLSNDFDNATTNDTTHDMTNDTTHDMTNDTTHDTTNDIANEVGLTSDEQVINLDPDESETGAALPSTDEKQSTPTDALTVSLIDAVPGSEPVPDVD